MTSSAFPTGFIAAPADGAAGTARRVAILLAGVLILLAACAGESEPPPDAAAAREAYADLRARARDGMLAWQSAGGHGDDPRPQWAEELEAFVVTYPGTPEAAEACVAALDLYAESREVEGFFRTWDLALRYARDEPTLRTSFQKVGLMRMVEAGGLGVLIFLDDAARMRAWRLAAPKIAADMERVIAATTNQDTRAAARYTIGLTWYQMGLDPGKALQSFRAVARDHPGWSKAGSARMYVRELEDLAIGNEAPRFEATTLEGEPLSLESLRGRVVLIDFCAGWSDACAEQVPYLKQALRRYRGRGLEVIGVNLDEDLDAARSFIVEHGVDWPVVGSGQGMLDPLALEYGIQSIPATYLIGRDGRIVQRGIMGEEISRAVGRVLTPPEEP